VKVLFHYAAGARLREEVARFATLGLEVVCCAEGFEQPFLAELADARVIWHVLQPITADVIRQAPKLELIQKIGVGVNTIDLDAARSRGIAVCNMPGTNSRAVAEMSLLLMLSALRRQYCVERSCRTGKWVVDAQVRESLGELCGRTVGIVGFGEVPRILAPILEAMGARVIYTARSRKEVAYPFVSLRELLQVSDIVTLHVPLTAETEKLIDRSRMALMKRGAILINTARGALIDEIALHVALVSGALGAAGLDVFAHEPAVATNPLLALDNVAVAPHLAWLTNETLGRSIDVAVRNSLAIRDSVALEHRVV
jgi:phosphoglycerate dehydrogenase-like enzyme